MNCPHCCSTRITQLQRTTDMGYAVFRCKECCRTFNERTGTPFNFLEVPTDIVFQVLLCRLRYKLSFRDIAEFFLLRGFEFTHETVRDWEECFAPIFSAQAHQLAEEVPQRVVSDGHTSSLRSLAGFHSISFQARVGSWSYNREHIVGRKS